MAGRASNLELVTTEGKRALLQSKSWEKTREHLKYFIIQKWAPSAVTVRDYLNIVQMRLRADPETKGLIK